MTRLSEVRIGAVIGIDGDVAHLIDRKTGMSFDCPMSAPGGLLPMTGDLWSFERYGGYWAFDRIVSSRLAVPERSFAETMATLEARGLINPSYIDGSHEAPQLAYIGQLRWFAFIPDNHWVAAGSSVNRVLYRELAEVIDPYMPGVSDPVTYWTTPLVVPAAPTFGVDGAVRPYFLARK